jgi:WD40 repeat protein
LAFTPDSTRLLSRAFSGPLKVWNVRTGEKEGDVDPLDDECGVAGPDAGLSPDGRTLAVPCEEDPEYPEDGEPIEHHVLQLWDMANAARLSKVPIRRSFPMCLRFGLAGDRIGVLARGGVQFFSLPQGELLGEVELDGAGPGALGTEYALSADLDWAAESFFGDEQGIRIWSLPAGEIKRLPQSPPGAAHLAFSPDGGLLLAGGSRGEIRSWSIPSGRLVGTAEGHSLPVNAFAFSPDGGILYSAGSDETIRIWSLPELDAVDVLSEEGREVYSLALSPDGRVLASGGKDGVLSLWETSERTRTRLLQDASLP